jgi:hypothetical protein
MRNYLLGLVPGLMIAGGAAAWAGAWHATPETVDACVLRHLGQLPSASDGPDFYHLHSLCAGVTR